MVKIQLQSDCPDTNTIVPNEFIDRFMPEANGEFVKVYLYLLRCIRSHACICTISAIADKFNNTEMDILRALRYWQKVGLLALNEDNGQICGIRLLSFPPEEKQEDPAPALSETSDSVNLKDLPEQKMPVPAETMISHVPVRRRYTADEIMNFRKDETLSELFFIVETYLKHPLSENEINTVLFWYEELHFTTELIVYLLEYCISKGHSSMRYMDKVAISWNEKGITSVEQAKQESACHSQVYYGVMKALGITGRNLVDSETSFIRKWTKVYGFDLSIIQEACQRTISMTHQPSFEYTDSILSNWYQNHVHTTDDIKKLDEAHSKTQKAPVKSVSAPRKNRFNNFSSRDYDYDNLEEMLLSSSVH